MRILVTGGAGFIGSHVADAYIAEGHTVTVIDNLSTGHRNNVNRKARFVEADIRGSTVADVFAEDRFDAVSHHAAQIDVRKSVADPMFDADINVLGTLNLLQQCVKAGVKRFIFASTGGAIYGEQERFPADETHPARPISPYGVSKLAVEHFLHYYWKEYGLLYCSLRYSNVYGPRQGADGEAGVIAIFTDRLLSGSETVINGDGGQARDFVYVGDVVRANLLALGLDEPTTVNIGTSVETTINEIFHVLNSISGAGATEKHGPPMPGEQRRSVIDPAYAKRLMEWEPTVELEEGLARTVESFRREAETNSGGG